LTDGNTYAINKHLDDQEDYDALQEVTAELEQAEARIEELEAALEGKAQDLTECAVCVYELEAKLAKAVRALESIAPNTCCDRCQDEAALWANATLAELSKERSDEKGQDDE
jgi:DNA repair exonuclease SbcCD ATPase subunit